jgi:ankyrin repeat protein
MPFVFLKDPYFWGKLRYRIKERWGRLTQHKVFAAIERGDDAEALRLATPRVLSHCRGVWGETPLVAAIAASRFTLIPELIQRGGMVEGDGTLAHAAMRGDLLTIQLLLANGKNPDEPLPRGEHDRYTPLMWATNRKYTSIIRALLAAGADVNAVAANGNTAAIFTMDGKPENVEALDILCSYGADVMLKDFRGRSVVHEARDRSRFSGRPELRRVIEKHYPSIDVDAV